MEVLTPSNDKRLKNVCTLISENYSSQVIVPQTILGKQSIENALFLRLKENLKRRGVDVLKLSPSASLQSFSDKYLADLIIEITLLTGGKKTFDLCKVRKRHKGLLSLINPFNRHSIIIKPHCGATTFKELIETIAINKLAVGVAGE